MTPTEKHREAARAVLADLFGDTIIEKPSLQIVAEHLAKAEREGMMAERDRCADLVEQFAPGGERWEWGHDDASMRVAIRGAIISEAGEA